MRVGVERRRGYPPPLGVVLSLLATQEEPAPSLSKAPWGTRGLTDTKETRNPPPHVSPNPPPRPSRTAKGHPAPGTSPGLPPPKARNPPRFIIPPDFPPPPRKPPGSSVLFLLLLASVWFVLLILLRPLPSSTSPPPPSPPPQYDLLPPPSPPSLLLLRWPRTGRATAPPPIPRSLPGRWFFPTRREKRRRLDAPHHRRRRVRLDAARRSGGSEQTMPRTIGARYIGAGGFLGKQPHGRMAPAGLSS